MKPADSDRSFLDHPPLLWTDILRIRDLRVLADSLREPLPEHRAYHSTVEAALEARIRQSMKEEIKRLSSAGSVWLIPD